MTRLDHWLKQATKRLSADSIAQVRAEIQEHYDSALADALHRGASNEEADRSAVVALGDARVANHEYRQILLTSAEARLLREGNWEARAICSHAWVKRLLPAIPVVGGLIGAIIAREWLILACGLACGFNLAAPLLPIFTPMRSRLYRYVKWALFAGVLAFAFGPNGLKWSWLLFSCLGPVAWVEWLRVSIRRKLPIEEWPKQLYL